MCGNMRVHKLKAQKHPDHDESRNDSFQNKYHVKNN